MNLVVGIDVDGVLVDTGYLENIATKLYGPPKHPEEYYTSKRYELSYDEDKRFYKAYRKDYILNAPTVPGIDKLGEYLTKREIPHFIITNRGADCESHEEAQLIYAKTKELVYQYFPAVQDIIFNGIGTKLPECLRNGVNVMIEDCSIHAKILSEFINCILIERDHNIDFRHPKVVHAKDLSQVPHILEVIGGMIDGKNQ